MDGPKGELGEPGIKGEKGEMGGPGFEILKSERVCVNISAYSVPKSLCLSYAIPLNIVDGMPWSLL